MEPDERSRKGLFMAFQYPMEIPGVSNANFLRAARASAVAGRRGTRRNRVLSAALRENGSAGYSERVHGSLGQ